ncbi:MAG: 50S ribosomal protein L17 [Acidobacteriota bacterium]
MRHRWGNRKLGRTSSHRKALLRTMVTELLEKEKIVTTVPKAKELRSFAEKMITLGKRDSLHARRQALSVIRTKAVVHKLFDSLAPRFADRQGGYTRIIRLGFRRGDSAEIAILELIGSDSEKPAAPKKKETKKKAAPKKAEGEKKAGSRDVKKTQGQAAEKDTGESKKSARSAGKKKASAAQKKKAE